MHEEIPMTDEDRKWLEANRPTPPAEDAPTPVEPPTPETRSPMIAEKCMQCGTPHGNTCSDLCANCVLEGRGHKAEDAPTLLSLPLTLEVGKPITLEVGKPYRLPVAAADPEPVLPFTLEELFNDPRASKEACRLDDDLKSAMAANNDLRTDLRRARMDLTTAHGRLDQYRRALREGALELNAAGVRTTVDHLVNQPAELPSLVRRLARSVRELQPSIDGLRAEVKRLNGEALEHPKQLAAKDTEISHLQTKIAMGEQREKALERTAQTMQTARDQALQQLKTQQSFGLDAARANDELRAKVEELQGMIAKLRAPKPEAKAS